jgi:hypothetical protein
MAIGGPFHLLLVEQAAIGGQVAVHGELAGGPLPGLVHVGRDRHRQADDDLGGGTAGGGRRFGDGRDHAALDHRPSGHPGQGALGQFASQAQHGRSEGGDQDGEGLGVRHPEGADHGRGAQRLAVEIDGPLVDEGPQHRQVLPHVARRLLEGDAHHPFDDQLMGQADAEDEASPVAAWVVRAWPASTMGWRGQVGTTAVPSVMPGTSRQATARAVRASRPKTWGNQADRTPASAMDRT